MSTKPPSSVQEFPAESLEKIAYMSVSAIPAHEPNDRNRLGYHVWRWLKTKEGTLDQVVAESGARLGANREDVVRSIRDALLKMGVSV